ncbi:MAG: Phosphate:acyl-ACP acyltransferase PlsX (EC [uncultured Chloroflexi bacterium]|uniref:Phosphate acyltransferase n=1 Tax=uncultured Chloroflexota bacterium TaxID=166587 RepID=A0A6J4I6R8_9CHLR|nr:MAG: Phosphate:acyl-ACP acyltransferase PlsX (EC [uncultured Chloroflexota bacterium]
MKVAVDAMGGDQAPQVVVEGAVLAAREGHAVVLVGREPEVRGFLAGYPGAEQLPIEVVHAAEVVGMDEHPATAVRQKKDSSIVAGVRLLKDGGADAFYSAGNSGAVMAAALFVLGRQEGVHRPAIGGVIPLLEGRVFMVDIGANADCEAQNLLQFGHLGAAYMRHMFGIARPRVGLVNIGEEETKGNALVQATYPLLRESGLNFVGNVEGKDVTRGAADVVVTDGFTGNVMLKLAEGMQELMLGLVRGAIMSKPHYKLAGAVLRPGLREAGRRLDYTEHGGAPLVGVRGAVFIGHGRSNAKAIASGVRAAAHAARIGLVQKIQGDLLAASLSA